jgi:hypothetical protein
MKSVYIIQGQKRFFHKKVQIFFTAHRENYNNPFVMLGLPQSNKVNVWTESLSSVTFSQPVTTAPATPSSDRIYLRVGGANFWIYPSGGTQETLLWDDSRQFCTNCTLAFLEGTPQASSENYSLQCPVVKHYDCLANMIELSFSLLDWVKYHDPHSF